MLFRDGVEGSLLSKVKRKDLSPEQASCSKYRSTWVPRYVEGEIEEKCEVFNDQKPGTLIGLQTFSPYLSRHCESTTVINPINGTSFPEWNIYKKYATD